LTVPELLEPPPLLELPPPLEVPEELPPPEPVLGVLDGVGDDVLGALTFPSPVPDPVGPIGPDPTEGPPDDPVVDVGGAAVE
jgi:hypothetical protein